MTPHQPTNWQSLAEQASREMDPKKPFFVTYEVPCGREAALSLGVLAMRCAVLAHVVIGSDMDDESFYG
jgi:hypothetical protein